MEYHLLWEIPAGIILLLASYYCASQSDAKDIIEE